MALLVLVAASGALAVSMGWAMTRGEPWTAGRFAPGMMGYAPSGSGEPVRGIDAARRQAGRFAEGLGLRADEVMRFENQYYVELMDSAGKGATGVLVDPDSGAVATEYGPAMMWNTRYGMMSARNGRGAGMMGASDRAATMGRRGAGPTFTPPPARRGADMTAPEAERIADRWARASGAGMRAEEAEPFPGYYTVHTKRGGRVAGMVSVNSATGAVWPHWWHGRLLSMSESG